MGMSHLASRTIEAPSPRRPAVLQDPRIKGNNLTQHHITVPVPVPVPVPVLVPVPVRPTLPDSTTCDQPSVVLRRFLRPK